MIISFLHKFVFTAIPKTGTHSVRQALRQHLGANDMEQVALFVGKALPIPELAEIKHGHISLRQLQPHFESNQFSSFFKFAFVRNPYDRFVSYCAFMTRFRGEFRTQPQRVMSYFIQNPPWHHVLFQLQSSFVMDSEGELMTDYLGRTEDMQRSYDEIAIRIGIPTAQLDRVNHSERREYQCYYTPPLVDGVARLYARDIETFGYEF